MRRPGQVLSQMQLLDAAWDLGYEQKLERGRGLRALPAQEDEAFGVAAIETVRGVGYRLRR